MAFIFICQMCHGEMHQEEYGYLCEDCGYFVKYDNSKTDNSE